MSDKDTNPETLIEFPCDFPIKVMAQADAHVKVAIEEIMAAHPGPAGSLTARDSRTGKYVAYTVTLSFTSKTQLDETYRLFHALDGVRMVL